MTSASGRRENSKVLKKLRRKQALFLTQEPGANVSFVEDPSNHVFIGNGGVYNAISGEILEELFTMTPSVGSEHHPTVCLEKKLYMPFGKDYAFASFASVEYAMFLVEALNGVCIQDIFEKHGALHRLCPSLAKGPPLHLYLCFIDRVPSFVLHTQEETCPASLLPGLILIPNFISEQEEYKLLEFFNFSSKDDAKDYADMSPSEFDENVKGLKEMCSPREDYDCPESALKHRRVKHYGYEFLYGISKVNPNNPLPGGLPEVCMPALKRMLGSALIHKMPDQLTVNQYLPGAGIPSHVDTHSAFEDGIISISLGSQVVMEFRHPDSEVKVPVFLARRSLLIMTGESRYLWTHGIAARKTDTVYPQMLGYHVWQQQAQSDSPRDPSSFPTVLPRGTRLSLTFRKVLRGPCTCEYPLQCDSRQSAALK